MLLREVLQEEDDWAAGEWSSPSNDNEHAIEEPRGRSQSDWGMGSLSPTDDTFGWGGFNGGGPSDSNAIRRERERADREVDSLWTQYQREQWTAWKSFVTGPSMESESAHRRSVRRRKTQCRLSGPTRLSSVTSIDDLPDVIPEVPNYEDEWNCRGDAASPGSELSSAESEGSDQGGISSSVAAKNIRSDVSSDWKTWSWPQASGAGSLPLPPRGEEFINPSGRVSPPSPTSTSPPPLSPTGSIGSSPLSSSSMSSWDDEEDDNRRTFSMSRTYKPRDDTGVAMMELGAMEARSGGGGQEDDDWLPAWGA